MSNGGRESEMNLVAALEKILAEPLDHETDPIKREVNKLKSRQARHIDFSFGFAAWVFKQLRYLRSCIPLRPWMAKAAGGVGVLGAAGLIWAASAVVKDMNGTKVAVAANADSIAAVRRQAALNDDALREEMKPLSEGMAVTNAKLDMLLRSSGMRGPSRHQLRAARVELGLPPDSTTQDTGQ